MENSRFKFRGVLTVEYGGENADDKTVDLIIEKADAIYGGCIGFDIDQLDAAIEKAGITDDIEIDQIHEFCYDNNGCRSDEYFVMDGDIEQCTGLKDKNGNLIYESDYVKANDVIYRVFWDKTKISLVNILNGDIIDVSETITMEIVGNEHEKDNISEIPKNPKRSSD